MPSSSSSIPTQRLPAPSLFVAPPSRNASNLDVSKNDQLSKTTSQTSAQSHAATLRLTPSAAIPGPASPLPTPSAQQGSLRPSSPTKTRRQQQQQAFSSSTSAPDEALETHFPPPPPDPTGANTPINSADQHLLPANQQQQQQQQQQQRRPRRGTAVLDAHWAALQSTLSDIELSASGTSHVFGPSHANALEDLRRAQVELARAWGPRGGADDALNDDDSQLGRLNSGGGVSTRSVKEAGVAGHGNGEGLKKTETQQTDASVNASKARTSQSEDKAKGVGNTGGVGAEETNADLEAAEQRRKESDAYFQKVKEGVEEVVKKLEGVSRAMRDVEMESREIWGDGTSDASTELDNSSVMT